MRLRAYDGTRHASSRLAQRSLLPTTICWSSGPHRPAQRAGRGARKRQSLPESAQNWISGYRYTHTFVITSCTPSFTLIKWSLCHQLAVEYKYICDEVKNSVLYLNIFSILLPSAVGDVFFLFVHFASTAHVRMQHFYMECNFLSEVLLALECFSFCCKHIAALYSQWTKLAVSWINCVFSVSFLSLKWCKGDLSAWACSMSAGSHVMMFLTW